MFSVPLLFICILLESFAFLFHAAQLIPMIKHFYTNSIVFLFLRSKFDYGLSVRSRIHGNENGMDLMVHTGFCEFAGNELMHNVTKF